MKNMIKLNPYKNYVLSENTSQAFIFTWFFSY